MQQALSNFLIIFLNHLKLSIFLTKCSFVTTFHSSRISELHVFYLCEVSSVKFKRKSSLFLSTLIQWSSQILCIHEDLFKECISEQCNNKKGNHHSYFYSHIHTHIHMCTWMQIFQLCYLTQILILLLIITVLIIATISWVFRMYQGLY